MEAVIALLEFKSERALTEQSLSHRRTELSLLSELKQSSLDKMLLLRDSITEKMQGKRVATDRLNELLHAEEVLRRFTAGAQGEGEGAMPEHQHEVGGAEGREDPSRKVLPPVPVWPWPAAGEV